MKPTRGNQLAWWCSTLATIRLGVAQLSLRSRLGAETLVAHQRLAARPSRRAKQDVFDLQLQVLVRRNADGIVHVALLEGVVDLRLGERGGRAERHAFALRLLPFNFRHEQVVPVRSNYWVYPGFPTLFWGLSGFFVDDLMERPCGSSWKTRSVFRGAVGAFCAATAPAASTGPIRMRQDRRVLGLQSTRE